MLGKGGQTEKAGGYKGTNRLTNITGGGGANGLSLNFSKAQS